MEDDFVALKEAIAGVFRLQYEGQDVPDYEALDLPDDLRAFLGKKPPKAFDNDYKALEWFYDDSSLWELSQIAAFMEKLWYIMYVKNTITVTGLSGYMKQQANWKTEVLKHGGSRFMEIVEGRDLADEHESLKKDLYKWPADLVRFFRNVFTHHDQNLQKWEMISKPQLDCMLHDIIPYACSAARKAVEQYFAGWTITPSKKFAIRYLLSSEKP